MTRAGFANVSRVGRWVGSGGGAKQSRGELRGSSPRDGRIIRSCRYCQSLEQNLAGKSNGAAYDHGWSAGTVSQWMWDILMYVAHELSSLLEARILHHSPIHYRCLCIYKHERDPNPFIRVVLP